MRRQRQVSGNEYAERVATAGGGARRAALMGGFGCTLNRIGYIALFQLLYISYADQIGRVLCGITDLPREKNRIMTDSVAR